MLKKLAVVFLLGGGGYLVWRYMTVIDDEYYSNNTGFLPDVGGFIKTAAGMASGGEDFDDMLPNKQMQVSTAYLPKIKQLENGIKKGWDSVSKKWFVHDDGAGFATIAYGHKVLKTDDYSKGISDAEATGLLLLDIQERLDFIRDRVTVPLTQGQFDALLDFIYNAGEGSYLGTGSAAKKLGNNIPKAINTGGFDAGFAQIRRHYEYVAGLPKYKNVAVGLLNRFKAQYMMAYNNEY